MSSPSFKTTFWALETLTFTSAPIQPQTHFQPFNGEHVTWDWRGNMSHPWDWRVTKGQIDVCKQVRTKLGCDGLSAHRTPDWGPTCTLAWILQMLRASWLDMHSELKRQTSTAKFSYLSLLSRTYSPSLCIFWYTSTQQRNIWFFIICWKDDRLKWTVLVFTQGF